MAAELLAIVGPTASGKTALAIDVAKKFQGEIICADSRTVYTGMDIGTAKPSKAEQGMIPHHLLDVVTPEEPFTVVNFQRLAKEAIADISARKKLPILVGGSGLYIDSVLYDYQFPDGVTERDAVNSRHRRADKTGTRSPLRERTIIVGLRPERSVILERITRRIDEMIAHGLLDEVRQLVDAYPRSKALDAPGYKALREYINGHISLDEAKVLFIKNDYQLAKRQMTWFKRNNDIQWCDDPSKYVEFTTTLVNKLQ